ncbi:O-methyltransferase [Penicillium manginii]|uniref:O-methyltransferase n=1 Tax=Penicillium manginii TaxID=203109 RepID=UPI0025471C23|nr:O-methyltransferase [Penicillium manginii]KAJ5742902.1 O-methyltransferase [Penicillium manginii]
MTRQMNARVTNATEKYPYEWLFDYSDLVECCYDFFEGGWYLTAFLEKHHDAPGRIILQDLPHVLEGVKLDDRLEETIDYSNHSQFRISSSFYLWRMGYTFDCLLGARAYYMKFILHDWSDGECLQILGNLRASMKKDYSRLIIEEFIVADKDAAVLPTMWDLQMRIHLSTMERARNQWQKLLSVAGFRVVKMVSARGRTGHY